MVVGQRRLAVIEPATPYASERAVLDAMLAGLSGEVVAILLTHHHGDHTGDAVALRERTGAPIYAHPATAARVDFAIDRLLGDGEVIELDAGHAVTAMHTPGHAPGHLVYSERRTGWMYAGDMVAGVGTILIDPEDDGDMVAYLDSLQRMAGASPQVLVPAHGPVQADPQGLLQRYRAHRLMREDRVLAAIHDAPRDLSAVLAEVYADTPAVLMPLASRSLVAHVRKLTAEGRVSQAGTQVRRVPSAPRASSAGETGPSQK